MDELTERQLIKRFKRGDTAAFDTLMTDHYDKVYALACRTTGSEDEAHALAQDVFVQAYQSLGGFDGRSRLATWLYSITVNKGIDRRRAAAAQRKLGIVPGLPDLPSDGRGRSGEDPTVGLDAEELGEMIARAMARIPEDQRATLELVTHGQVSYVDAARALDCSKQTVAWRVWNARRLLREMLQDYLKP